MTAPTIRVKRAGDGTRTLTFHRPAVVEGSGETRRVIKAAQDVSATFGPDEWRDFVALLLDVEVEA